MSRRHPNLRFQHVDLRNGHYNPQGGVDSRALVFPFPNGCFDFVFSWSVFTHVLPDTATNYLNEIARVLKPGKRALLTFLLLDGHPATVPQDVSDARGLVVKCPLVWNHHGVYSVLFEDDPERSLAYQRSFVTDSIAQARLRLEAVHNGTWSHLYDCLSFQDIVIVSKQA